MSKHKTYELESANKPTSYTKQQEYSSVGGGCGSDTYRIWGNVENTQQVIYNHSKSNREDISFVPAQWGFLQKELVNVHIYALRKDGAAGKG